MGTKIWSATKQLAVLLVLAAIVAVVGYLFMYGYFDRNRFRILDTPSSVRFDDGDMVQRWDRRIEDRISYGVMLQPIGAERGKYAVFLYPPFPTSRADRENYRQALLDAFAETAGYRLEPGQAAAAGGFADHGDEKSRQTGTLRYVPTGPSAWFGDGPVVLLHDSWNYHDYAICNIAVVPAAEADARLLLDIDYVLDSYIIDWWCMRSEAARQNLAEIGATISRRLEITGAAASARR